MSDEVFNSILRELMNGPSMVKAIKNHGIHPFDFTAFLIDRPELKLKLKEFQKYKADFKAEETLDIADDESIDPTRAKNMIDSRRWFASKLNREQYGENIQFNQVYIDAAKIIEVAQQRTATTIDAIRSIPGCDLEETAKLNSPDISDTNNNLQTGIQPVTQVTTPTNIDDDEIFK